MRLMWRLSLVVALCAGILASVLSCTKKPTKPKENPGLRLYISDVVASCIYAIDPDVDSVLDSLPDVDVLWMEISPDGKWLYGLNARRTAQSLLKIDTRTMEIAARREIVGGGGLALVDGGATLFRAAGGLLEFIDPETWEVRDTASLTLRDLASADTVSFVIGVSAPYVTCYNYLQKRVISAVGPFGIPGRPSAVIGDLSLHPSGKFGYGVIRDTPYEGWFVAFDTPSLAIKYIYPLSYDWGRAEPSPDGRYVLVTDPGPVMAPPTITGHFFVFDVAANQIVKIVDTDTLTLLEETERPAAVGEIVYSPDGAVAYISTGAGGSAQGPVLVFDMGKLEFVQCIRAPLRPPRQGVAAYDIAVGPEP